MQSENATRPPPPSPDKEKVTALSRYADSITKDNARLTTRCESVTNSSILRSIKRRIKLQENKIIAIRKQTNKIIKNNDLLHTTSELLANIPGVGEVCSHIVLAELPQIQLFKNARQLAAWAGLTPNITKVELPDEVQHQSLK